MSHSLATAVTLSLQPVSFFFFNNDFSKSGSFGSHCISSFTRLPPSLCAHSRRKALGAENTHGVHHNLQFPHRKHSCYSLERENFHILIQWESEAIIQWTPRYHELYTII